jgi:hypothetical protein
MTFLEQITPMLRPGTLESLQTDLVTFEKFKTGNIKFEEYSYLLETEPKLKLFVEILKHKNRIHKYVILKEDERGRYCEYAFAPGAPEDNRCLSWYNKLQPVALERNGHDVSEWKISPVGEVYFLNAFNCGQQDETLEDFRCRPGHPSVKCMKGGCAMKWTYDEPVKCACWYLEKVNLMGMKLDLSMEDVVACV